MASRFVRNVIFFLVCLLFFVGIVVAYFLNISIVLILAGILVSVTKNWLNEYIDSLIIVLFLMISFSYSY